MANKRLNPDKYAIIEEMNNAMGGLTLEELQTVCKGRMFRFPVYPLMEAMNQDVAAMDMSARAQNALHRTGLGTIRALVEKVSSENNLQRIKNIGALTVREVMFNIFLFQFAQFDTAGKKRYMKRVLEMNGIKPKEQAERKPA